MKEAQEIPKLEALLSDESLFHRTVYTPIDEAVRELKERWHNDTLKAVIASRIEVPSVFDKEPSVSLFRHICTPNFDSHRFVCVADALELAPLFITYEQDKFVSGNPQKLHTAKMRFYKKRDDDQHVLVSSAKIADVGKYDGKPLKDIQTVWGENTISFHRRLFFNRYTHLTDKNVYDISSWYKQNGGVSANYYGKLIYLFIRNTILLENFLFKDQQEHPFIRDVFLPAFLNAWSETGFKPLIATLAPTELESHDFWLSYPDSFETTVYNYLDVGK